MSMGLVDITLDSDSEDALQDVVDHLMQRFSFWDEIDELPIRKLPNQQRWRLRITVETRDAFWLTEVVNAVSLI